MTQKGQKHENRLKMRPKQRCLVKVIPLLRKAESLSSLMTSELKLEVELCTLSVSRRSRRVSLPNYFGLLVDFWSSVWGHSPLPPWIRPWYEHYIINHAITHKMLKIHNWNINKIMQTRNTI